MRLLKRQWSCIQGPAVVSGQFCFCCTVTLNHTDPFTGLMLLCAVQSPLICCCCFFSHHALCCFCCLTLLLCALPWWQCLSSPPHPLLHPPAVPLSYFELLASLSSHPFLFSHLTFSVSPSSNPFYPLLLSSYFLFFFSSPLSLFAAHLLFIPLFLFSCIASLSSAYFISSLLLFTPLTLLLLPLWPPLLSSSSSLFPVAGRSWAEEAEGKSVLYFLSNNRY